jgi:hypothetical protein
MALIRFGLAVKIQAETLFGWLPRNRPSDWRGRIQPVGCQRAGARETDSNYDSRDGIQRDSGNHGLCSVDSFRHFVSPFLGR